MSEEIKATMKSFKPKQAQSKRNAAQYWVDSCRDVFGMVDVGGPDGGANNAEDKKMARMHIRFRDGWSHDPTRMVMRPNAAKDENEMNGITSPPAALAKPEVPEQITGRQTRPRTSSDESGFSLSAFDDIEGIEFDEQIDGLLNDPTQQISLGDGAAAAAASSVAELAELSIASGVDEMGGQTSIPRDHRRSSIRASLLEPVSDLDCSSGDFGVNSANYLLNMLKDSAGEQQLQAHCPEHTLQRSQRTETSQNTGLTQHASAASGAYLNSLDDDSAQNTRGIRGIVPATSIHVADSASLASMIRNQQILACQTALSLTQTAKQSNSRPSLADLGRMIYRAFLGREPPSVALSSNRIGCNEDGQSATLVEETRESFACAVLESDDNSASSSMVGNVHHKRQRHVIHTTSTRPVFSPHIGVLESKMREADLPVQLAILISSLINADDEECVERYHSIEDLEQDILAMVVDPDRYLFDLPLENQTGRLFDRSGKLYGREVQQKQLVGPFQRVLSSGGPREAIYVSGVSGTGKSSLVQLHVASSTRSLNGRVISGKFDALRQRQPCEVICQSLDNFCRSLSTATDGASFGLRNSIAGVIDAEGLGTLSGLMPSIQSILPPDLAQQTRLGRRSSGLEGLNQLFYYLNLFIAAISSTATPILFVFDDLQWCDEAAFDIFTRIITERSLASFLFVGCYRDDEISEGHPLQKHRQDLLEAGIFTSDVILGAFDKGESNEYISDILHLPKRITKSLSDSVSAKTSGNPLFMKEFLLSLCGEGLLQYSASARRWYWDMEAIQIKDVTDSVADLLTSKMSGLNTRVQDLLKLIACLGSECKASTLSKLNVFADIDLMEREMFLKILTNEGMLSQIGNDMYKFSHDKVQQAAYQLIRPLDRAGLHLEIGRQLRKKTPTATELDSMIFTIVDQLSRGLDLVTDQNEKKEIARLCLMAGKKAMAKSSVGPASIYHLQGTALLQESDWTTDYDLVRIHTSLSTYFRSPLTHSSTFIDEFPQFLK